MPTPALHSIAPDVTSFQPDPPGPSPLSAFFTCLRTARRGAAAGPFRCYQRTPAHAVGRRNRQSTHALAAERLAQADVPSAALAAIHIGRIVALQKPDGRGIRAVVVGDVLRCLVGQAFAPEHERACLSTRAGSEALPRVLRAAAEVDAREAMLGDDCGTSHDVVHGEQSNARAVCPRPTARTGGGASPAPGPAYLDDTYIIATPEQVCEPYEAYPHALWTHARVELNRSNRRVWNAVGEEPPGLQALHTDPDTAIWVGDWALPPDHKDLPCSARPSATMPTSRTMTVSFSEWQPWMTSRRRGYCCVIVPAPMPTTCCVPCRQVPWNSMPATTMTPPRSSALRTPLPPEPTRATRLARRFGGLGLRAAFLASKHEHPRSPSGSSRRSEGRQPDACPCCLPQSRPPHTYDGRAPTYQPGTLETHLADLSPASRALLFSQAGLRGLSQSCPPPMMSPSQTLGSELCCFAGCACLSRSLRAVVLAVERLCNVRCSGLARAA